MGLAKALKGMRRSMPSVNRITNAFFTKRTLEYIALTILLIFGCIGCRGTGALESTSFPQQDPLLFEALVREIAALSYDQASAQRIADFIFSWKGRSGEPDIVRWKTQLDHTRQNSVYYLQEQQRLSEAQIRITQKMVHCIRKRIPYNKKWFDLTDTIEQHQGQCIAYAQLYFVIGQSIGLNMIPINVLEEEPDIPFLTDEGHVTCMVRLPDHRTMILDPDAYGLMRSPFDFKIQYTQDGMTFKHLNNRRQDLLGRIQILDPNGLKGHLLNSRGARAFRNQHNDPAFSLFTQAIDLNPTLAEAYNNRAIVYCRRHQSDLALEDCNQAITIYPAFSSAYNTRGACRFFLKQYKQALQDFTHAIALRPSMAKAFYNRANTYIAMQDYDRALKDYDRAIRINPHYAQAHFQCAQAHGQLGHYQKAIACYSRAVQCNPALDEAYANRGLCHAITGAHQKAIQDLKTALNLNVALKESVFQISDKYNLNL